MLWKPRESWEEHSPLCVVLQPTDPACVYSSTPLSVWEVPGVLRSAAGAAFCWYFEGRREVGSFPDGVPTTGKGWQTAALWKGADNPGVGGTSGWTPAHGLGAISQTRSGCSPESRRSPGVGTGGRQQCPGAGAWGCCVREPRGSGERKSDRNPHRQPGMVGELSSRG